jgi:hypothetical protein
MRFTTKSAGRLVEYGVSQFELLGKPRSIDHVAMVVTTRSELDQTVDELVRHGASVVEAPGIWPDDVCDVAVPGSFRKAMATVALSEGLLVVSASLSSGDQLDRHLITWGADVPHHVAVGVASVERDVLEWRGAGYSIGPIVDDGDLSQVFMVSPAGQIVELIARRTESNGTFSCANIAALSAAEDALRSGEL